MKAKSKPFQHPSKIRCITLNLKGMSNDWFKGRENAVIKGLRRYQPDIVCLQETTLRHGSPSYNQARVIGDAIGLNTVAFTSYSNPIEVMSSDQGGVAVLSRWPMIDVRNRKLPSANAYSTDGRVALLVSIATPDGPLGVINTHLSWRPNEVELRLVQCGIILDEINRNGWNAANTRLILVGDFNADENEPAIELASSNLQDVYRVRNGKMPGHTWSSSNPHVINFGVPDRRLDYIFCPQGVQVTSAEVILDRAAVSDHFGVLADLCWSA